MRKFVQPVAITVTTYLKWCDLANQMIMLGYRAFDDHVFDMGFPYKMFTDVREGDPIFALISAGYSEWSDRRMVSCGNVDMFVALAAMSEGPDFYPGEWVIDSKQILKVIAVEGMFLRTIYGLISSGEVRKATVAEIIAHFEGDQSSHKEEHRFSIDRAKEIIAEHLELPVDQIQIDGR